MVVHNCTDLDLATRLKIVQETSLVECIFVEPSEVADVRFRIYLANREISFAGHPTLAGVASLLHRGLVNGKRLTVETQAGLIPIEVGENGHIIMIQIAPFFWPSGGGAACRGCLSLSVNDMIYLPQFVSTDLPFTVAVV